MRGAAVRYGLSAHTQAVRSTDPATVLSIYIALLLGVPSTLVFAPLGSAGSPSTVVGMLCFGWWWWHRLQRPQTLDPRPAGVRVAALLFLAVVMLAYAHAMSGPIPPDEISTADSGLLRVVGMLGVLLLALEGLGSAEMRILMHRLVVAGMLVALLGVVQYLTGQLWVDRISVPGLTPSAALSSLAQREGLSRPSATATTPIEFGVVLTMVLPLAITLAFIEARRRVFYVAATFVISFAVLLSISRSALIGGAIGVVVLWAGWNWSVRRRTFMLALAVVMCAYVTVPGLLGTLQGLFTGAANDPSVRSRTNSLDIAGSVIGHSLWMGRGVGTFLPRYWILDDEYLLLFVEVGVVGLVVFIGLIATSLWSARQAMQMSHAGLGGERVRALAAATAAGACGLGFFDAFTFPQSTGCFFIMLGLCGASWRVAQESANRRRPS